MAAATLVSRLTGFARIVLLAAILGAALSSAFTVANQLPNLIAALVLEATFTAIFVPVLARAERDDADGGAAFIRRLLTLTTTLLLVVTLASTVAAPLLVDVMLGSDPLVNRPLTTAFAYLLLPQIIFYGLSSVFMAILNTRNIFGPPAWAPVLNNVVAILTLGLYLLVPGELSADPVEMGNAKLLVLGIGTTMGVVAQAAVLFIAIRAQRVSLRPLWGIDARLKKFGMMALAMVLYVLLSQLGLVVVNQIASAAAASGPAIYNYTWLVLMLPFGIIGVTVLTVVMPRLSRNAAADNSSAVLADLSLATRLTMVTLIPIVAIMTVGGPAIGSALFAYGNFGEVDAGYLGMAITLSAFTLIPYGLVLLQLRVFYARQEPWTPIVLIIVITTVKIAVSVAVPHLIDDPDLIAGYLGMANGLGFLAGATAGYFLLRSRLDPPGGRLIGADVVRTILVTSAASITAGLIAYVVDRFLGLQDLTASWGGAGSLLRLSLLGVVMAPIIVAVMLGAGVPDAHAALGAVRRRLGRSACTETLSARAAVHPRGEPRLPYPDRSNSSAGDADGRNPKGSAVSDKPADGSPPDPNPPRAPQNAKINRPSADDFQPDVPDTFGALGQPSDPPAEVPARERVARSDHPTTKLPVPATPAPTQPQGPPSERSAQPPSPPPTQPKGPPPADKAGEPGPAEHIGGARREPPAEDIQLIPGAMIADGRYRLLVFHGGPPHLQFWQALDTALDRQVALTFIGPDGALPEREVQEILTRTQRLSSFDMPGVARVLDVTGTGAGGLIVSEWIRGGSLAEVAATSPSPIGGARAIQSLAAVADAAHRSGVTLSVDHPGRIRVSIEGDVALAFPATMPGATPEGDIRGIGAALYALLVNRWPLPETGAPSGLAPADQDAAGQPVEPRAMDRNIPFQISAAASHAVQDGGGIRSAPTLLNLLQQATAIADRTDHLAPVESAAPDARDHGWLGSVADPESAARRRKNLMVGLGLAAAVVVVAVIVLATVLGRIFGDVGDGLGGDELGLNAPTSESAPAGAGAVIKPVRATVFSPDGGADAPSLAGLAIDGDPATVWPTDTYSDQNPFPGFKNGVGLMLELPRPAVIGSVTINVNSTGTAVQIRSSSTATPPSLEDTTALTQPTKLKPGTNTIQVEGAAPTSNVLVWISTLGSVNGESRTDVSEITLKAAS
ncbi:MAG: murein biosynthesis integral membrane protein MurJ [Mycolicibacterium sp.]|uniref:murein biosynthesis integral membrane protein MurJ n=1 Tax=Mycolicibacterium sp. TaxID=2320850 RepID=UPI003D0BDC52